MGTNREESFVFYDFGSFLSRGEPEQTTEYL